MRPSHAAAIILAIALTLIASLNISPTAAAQTDCVQPLTATTTEGTWSTDCTSSIPAPHGSGDRYARFYAFTLSAESDITIDLSSEKDTYLYLRSGTSTEGSAPYRERRHTTTQPIATDSRIAETTQTQAPTPSKQPPTPQAATGDFTLTVSGIDFDARDDTIPSRRPIPRPPLPHVSPPSQTNMTVNGAWNTDCTSDISAPSGSGDRYARFYTFTLDAESDA